MPSSPATNRQKRSCMNMTKIPHRLYLTEDQMPPEMVQPARRHA